MNLSGLPLRTRSKVVKTAVCEALGYAVPSRFRKTRPRFPGQMFDTYVQKSTNLQVWNEELAPTRRYAIIKVSEGYIITKVRVVAGDTLAKLDTTGTLTQKYQARLVCGPSPTELVVDNDTPVVRPSTDATADLSTHVPTGVPVLGGLLPIRTVFQRLSGLVGTTFSDQGYDQERRRGGVLHRLVCQRLGYANYEDDGQFPDVRHQLLEVKLQTSPTIDLGLVRPDSTEPLDVPMVGGRQIRHCDVRYAVFRAQSDGTRVAITHLLLSTGQAFFGRFPQFQGRVLNKKLQIPLPADFFA
jgi:hypothetical protein